MNNVAQFPNFINKHGLLTFPGALVFVTSC